jgi:phage protein D
MTEEMLFKATVPVFKVDDEARHDLSRDLVRLEIEEDTEGLRSLSARFLAFGPHGSEPEERLLYLDGDPFDFGKRLEVSLGSPEEERVVFRGKISAIEADFEEALEPEVVVMAEDGLMPLRMTRRSKTWEKKTDAQIAKAIAGEHGLDASADAPGPCYDVVQQWNMSDLAFLRERARRIQAEVGFFEGKLQFKSRGTRTGPEITLVRGNQLIAVQLRADLAHQRGKVRLSGYDATKRDRIEKEAGRDALGAEVSGGRSGPQIVESVFPGAESWRVREVPLKDDEAEAWARAEMLRRGRRFVTVSGITNGTPDMIVGARLRLEGVGRPFEGAPYYVTRVQHTYDLHSAHRTHFEAERGVVSA